MRRNATPHAPELMIVKRATTCGARCSMAPRCPPAAGACSADASGSGRTDAGPAGDDAEVYDAYCECRSPLVSRLRVSNLAGRGWQHSGSCVHSECRSHLVSRLRASNLAGRGWQHSGSCVHSDCRSHLVSRLRASNLAGRGWQNSGSSAQCERRWKSRQSGCKRGWGADVNDEEVRARRWQARSRRRRARTSTLIGVVLLILAVKQALTAPSPSPSHGRLQEQEINLKLRILVPQDHRPAMGSVGLSPSTLTALANAAQLNSLTGVRPMGQILSAQMSPSISSLPSLSAPTSLMQSLPPISLPVRQSIAMPVQPVSVVSSVSSVASPMMGSLLSSRPSVTKVVRGSPHTGMASYPTFGYTVTPHYHTPTWVPPRPSTTLVMGGAAPTSPPQQPAPRPEHINITVIRSKPAKACNCTKAADTNPKPAPAPTPPPPPPEEPAPVEEDHAEELPPSVAQGPSPTPIPPSWLGYIPDEILDHAKKVLANNGKVNVQKEVNKLNFRQKWKHSNYPKKPANTVGDPWSTLKDDLADLVKTTNAELNSVDDDDAMHHDDADFDESMGDFEDGVQRDEFGGSGVDTDENNNQPYFVDFWGNRVPQYDNGFHDERETEEEARKEFSNDPNGWNPDYTKGLWSQNDQHLQVFSGHNNGGHGGVHTAHNQPRPYYDNGMGEGIEANYNRYVTDNGTWVGPRPDPIPDDDLRTLMQDAVSHEPALQNPSEVYPTYADVIRYLNSRRYPVRYRRTRPRPRPPPRPLPQPSRRPHPYAYLYPYGPPQLLPPHLMQHLQPQHLPPPPQPPRAAASQNNPNLVDVNQLVEALILHKEKERAKKPDDESSAQSKEDDGDYEDYADDANVNRGDRGDANDEADRPVRTSNAHTSSPSGSPGSVCRGVKDVGLAADGQQMAHVQGVVCVNSYDFAAGEGKAESTAQGDPPA